MRRGRNLKARARPARRRTPKSTTVWCFNNRQRQQAALKFQDEAPGERTDGHSDRRLDQPPGQSGHREELRKTNEPQVKGRWVIS